MPKTSDITRTDVAVICMTWKTSGLADDAVVKAYESEHIATARQLRDGDITRGILGGGYEISYHARPGIDGESAAVRHDTKRQASAYKKQEKGARDGLDSASLPPGPMYTAGEHIRTRPTGRIRADVPNHRPLVQRAC